LRERLKSKPALGGIRGSLFVTADRWSLGALVKDVRSLLEKNGAYALDAESMAAEDPSPADREAALGAFFKRLN
jgi:hypothetical protein